MRRQLLAGERDPRAHQFGGPERVVHVDSPAAAAAVVPHLLGFVPSDSLVVIGAGPPRGRVHVTLRYDLPDPPDRAAARQIAAHAVSVLAGRGQRMAVVIGYGAGTAVTGVVDAIRAEARLVGVELWDVLRVHDGRWWSYLCSDPSCHPVEGVPVDQRHPAATALAAAGGTVLSDRAALAATIAPMAGGAAQAMRAATRRAEKRLAALLARSPRAGRPAAAHRLVAAAGSAAVLSTIDLYRGGGRLTGDDEIAWLSVVLAVPRLRDDAWARMDPAYRDAHRRLWTDVLRRARRRYVPAPACLLAVTAWQAGHGALANVALDRALAAAPGYSLGLLLRAAIDAGAPPSMAAPPMTPQQVAASYAAAGDGDLCDGDSTTTRTVGHDESHD